MTNRTWKFLQSLNDEVKYCADLFKETPALFACRVANKWGIIEVVDISRKTKDEYDAEYGLTKRRIVVPCQFSSLEEADAQLGTPHEWSEPVPSGEDEWCDGVEFGCVLKNEAGPLASVIKLMFKC